MTGETTIVPRVTGQPAHTEPSRPSLLLLLALLGAVLLGMHPVAHTLGAGWVGTIGLTALIVAPIAWATRGAPRGAVTTRAGEVATGRRRARRTR